MRQAGKEPKNCAVCLPPLRDENTDAVKIYLLTRNQLIFAGMGEAVEINHLAVHAALDRLKIPNDGECFEKVLRLSAHMLDRSSDKNTSSGLDVDAKPPPA